MEPFSALLMYGAGLGLQAYGMAKTASAADKYNQAQVQQIQAEQRVEAQRRQAMEMDARRKRLENVRNVQRMRAVARANATNQGAQYGSGLQGGLAQIGGMGNWNALGIGQNLEIGRNIFAENQNVSNTKVSIANAQKDLGTAQGWSSLGQSLVGSAPAFGRVATQAQTSLGFGAKA